MGKNYVFGNPPSAVAPALICVLLWSTVASGFKLGLEHFAVEQLLFLGTCISWLVFLCYAIVTNQLALAASDRALAVGLGLINPTAYYLNLVCRLRSFTRPHSPTHKLHLGNYSGIVGRAHTGPTTYPTQPMGHTDQLFGRGHISSHHPRGGWINHTLGVALALLSTVLWASYWLLNTRSTAAPASLMFWSFSLALPIISVICWYGPGLPTLNLQALGLPSGLALLKWASRFYCGNGHCAWPTAAQKSPNLFLSPRSYHYC